MPARRTVVAFISTFIAKPLLLSAVIGFLLAACLCTTSTSYAQRKTDKLLRKREVYKVAIEGNENISTNKLSEWINTRESWWGERFLNSFTPFGRPRQYVDDAIIASDTESISDYYKANGYLEVRVSFRFDENQQDAAEWSRIRDKNRFLPPAQQDAYPDIRTTVVFVVTEGPPYTVAGFTFEGMEHLPLDILNTVTENIGIVRGSQYSAEAVIKEDERVRSVLGENGYPYFRRDSIIVESIGGTKSVGITVYFQTGHRYRMGDLKIIYDSLGATGRIRESVIRRQIPYEKGSWVKLSVFNEGERNLYTLGTFDYVFIYPDTSIIESIPDSLRDSVELPIIAELRTQTTVDISFGGFVATSRSNQLGAGFTVGLNHRNLFGGAEKLSLQGSIQPWPSSQLRWDGGASLEFPHVVFINAPIEVSANLSSLEEKTKFIERSYSGTIASRINIAGASISLRPGVSVEYLRRLIFDSSLAELKLPKDEQFNLILSNTALYDVTNDFFDPSKGTSISYGLEIGVPVLPTIFREDLPSASYIKNSLQLRQFFDLDGIGKSVFAVRLLGGIVSLLDPDNTARDIPITRRFLVGGASSLRGWPPTVLLMAEDTTNVTAISGGYQTLEGNIEWRFAPFRYDDAFSFFERFLADLRVALFTDAGNLWNKETPIALKNFAIASGIGLRYNTLFGAIRLDLGLKLYNPAPDLIESYDPKTDSPPPATPINTEGVWLWDKKFVFSTDTEIQFSIGLPF